MGKCNVTNMLIKSGNLDKFEYSGNTILLEISEENKKKQLCVCWCRYNIFFYNC